jgi:LuxR family transcriptional regulator, maltose regulon positive regulatory protein
MAEPARTRPPAASVAERDALLATKLHLPRPHPGFLARPRLLERLDESTARELTLVCAPAGFGKTTLLADWARSTTPSRPCWSASPSGRGSAGRSAR